MTRSDLANAVRLKILRQDGLQIPAHDIDTVLVALFKDVIPEATLGEGDIVHLAPYGKFFCKTIPAREGRNPQTGERIQIPTKYRIDWKPGKSYKTLALPATTS